MCLGFYESLFFLCYLTTLTLQQHCPTEYTPSDNIGVQFEWVSSNKTTNEVVFSNPVCYDKEERATYKICSGDRWSAPSRECYHFDADQQNFQKDEFQPCYFVNGRQPWSRCVLPKTNLCPSDTKKVTTLWMPYRRIVEYGPIVSIVLGEDYGEPIDDNDFNITNYDSLSLKDFFDRQCVYLNTTTNQIKIDYCESLHTLNCTFEEELNSQLCPKNCLYSMASQDCICKENKRNCGVSQSYAAVENLNEKYLMHELAGSKGCYLTGTVGKLREAINNKFWFYTDRNLECSFCKQNRKCSNTDLVLNFHDPDKKLYLTVYQPDCIFGLGDEAKIYCFTDATDKLVKRVNIDEEFKGDHYSFNVYEVELEDYVGNYWCVAHSAPIGSRAFLSNKVLASKKKYNEFAVKLSVSNMCSKKNCVDSENLSLLYQDIIKNISDTADDFNFYVRVMNISSLNELSIVFLLHFTSLNHSYAEAEPNRAAQAHEDYKTLNKLLKALSNNTQVIFYRSSDYCFEENYQGKSWPTIKGNNVATPNEYCVTEDGIPVFRLCSGDFMDGYIWTEVKGQCYYGAPSKHTEKLKEAIDKPVCVDGLKQVGNITKQASSDLQVMDIYYIAEFLNNVSNGLNKTVDVVNDTLEVIDGILCAALENLKEAQVFMNLTDGIMLVTEDISGGLHTDSDMQLIIKDNLIFLVFSPILTDISGFVLYENKTVKSIRLNEEFDYIKDINNILLAMYVPNEILDDLTTKNLTNTKVYTTVFLNDKFVSSSENSSSGVVINVNIPPYKAFLPRDLPILFRHVATNITNYSCAFWDLGNNFQRKKGDWSSVGSKYFGHLSNESRLQICGYSHLTHFGLLVLEKSEDLSTTETNTMNVLTAVGCFLSIIGILGIFVTAYLFNKWRERTGTQILLHLATATLLEIIFMYLNGLKLFPCKFAGMTIHYVILSKFAWMLVYAFCQYLRFVRVLGPMPKQLVLKSIIFGWGMPFIPVLTVSIANPMTYLNNDTSFCYPNGNSLYYGIYLPISIILLINLIILIKIFVYLSYQNVSGEKMVQARQYKLHKRLFVLLFFVLGIPWIFGLTANFVTVHWIQSILMTIFTATSTLQGFIMFLFYVLLNKETREFWKRSFKKYDVSESEKQLSNGSSISFINFKRN